MVSNAVYQPEITPEKKEKVLQQLQGYWMNDVWDLRDNFFKVYDSKESWRSNKKRIDFKSLSFYIRQELKYFFAIEILNSSVTIGTVLSYSFTFKHLSVFINKYYPNIHSFIEIPYERGLMKYKSYLINRNVNITNSKGQISSKAIAFFNRAYQFLFNFYDMDFDIII
ncbi:hypothetical protein [Bacillus toyonensis]|uniref:hypothetical protein n=1 Tax=Bacillus toyonensis TaxID=155322 RepID=UPI0020D23BC3|nr:hypothetical protein [Bacillus toyonensis]